MPLPILCMHQPQIELLLLFNSHQQPTANRISMTATSQCSATTTLAMEANACLLSSFAPSPPALLPVPLQQLLASSQVPPPPNFPFMHKQTPSGYGHWTHYTCGWGQNIGHGDGPSPIPGHCYMSMQQPMQHHFAALTEWYRMPSTLLLPQQQGQCQNNPNSSTKNLFNNHNYCFHVVLMLKTNIGVDLAIILNCHLTLLEQHALLLTSNFLTPKTSLAIAYMLPIMNINPNTTHLRHCWLNLHKRTVMI